MCSFPAHLRVLCFYAPALVFGSLIAHDTSSAGIGLGAWRGAGCHGERTYKLGINRSLCSSVQLE